MSCTNLLERLLARKIHLGPNGEEAGACEGARPCSRERAAGFTLTEALTTLLIVGLVTTILAGGIGLATRQYAISMSSSEAQMLYSSLQKILDTELRYTKEITVDSDGNLVTFTSKHYKAKKSGGGLTDTSKLCSVLDGPGSTIAYDPRTTPGQLGMASELNQENAAINTFLGSGAYNYGLQASVPLIKYDDEAEYFLVRLVISKGSGDDRKDLVAETFSVRALNLSSVTAAPTTPPGSTQAPTLTLSGISIPDNSSSGYPIVEKGYIYEYGGKLYFANGSAKNGAYASPTEGKIEFI